MRRFPFLVPAILAALAGVWAGDAQAQPVPTGLTAFATGQSGQVQLTWSPVGVGDASFQSYNIYGVVPGGTVSSVYTAGAMPMVAQVLTATTGSVTLALPAADDGQSGAYWVTTMDTDDSESAPDSPVAVTATSYQAISLTLTGTVLSYGNCSLTVTASGTYALQGVSIYAASYPYTQLAYLAPGPLTYTGSYTGSYAGTLPLAGTPPWPVCGTVSLSVTAMDSAGNPVNVPSALVLNPLCGPQFLMSGGVKTLPGGGVVLSWFPPTPPPLDGYEVAASPLSWTGSTLIQDPLPMVLGTTTSNSFTYVSTVAQSLLYRVYSVDAGNVTSSADANSNDDAYTLGPPAITNFTSNDGNSFSATWAAPGVGIPPFNYSLYGSTVTAGSGGPSPSSFSLIGNSSSNAFTYTGNSNYPYSWFFVGVTDSASIGSLSAPNGLTTSTLTPPTSTLLFAPALATPVTPTVAVLSGAVNLTWSEVTNATGYNVFRADVTSGPLTTTAALTYSDASFSASGSHYYTGNLVYSVQAFENLTPPGSVVDSPQSETQTALNPSFPPAPVSVNAWPTGTSGTVLLTWQPVTTSAATITSYLVFYSTTSVLVPTQKIVVGDAVGNSNSALLINEGLSESQATWFWVEAANNLGAGFQSATATAIPYQINAAWAPTLTAQALDFGQGVACSVSPMDPANEYFDVAQGADQIVEKLQGLTQSVATLVPSQESGPGPGSSSNPLTLTSNLFPCGQSITLTAVPYDIGGNTGAASAGVRFWFPCSPTAQAQSISTVGPGQAALNLTWSKPPGARTGTDYSVRYATGPGWTANVPGSVDASLPAAVTSTGGATSAQVAPLNPGQSYYYRVYAKDPLNSIQSMPSNEVSLLAPPTQLQAIPYRNQIFLSWTSPTAASASGLGGYVIYFATAAASSVPAFITPYAQSITVKASALDVTLTVAGGLQDATTYALAVASEGGPSSGPWLTGSASAAITVTTGLQGPVLQSVSGTAYGASFLAPPAPTLVADWTAGQEVLDSSSIYTLYCAVDATGTPQSFTTLFQVASVAVSQSARTASGLTTTPAQGSAVSLSFAASLAVTGPAWYFLNVTSTSDAIGYGTAGADITTYPLADVLTASARSLPVWAPNVSWNSPPSLAFLTSTASPLGTTNGRVALQWTPASYAGTYTVYRSTQQVSAVTATKYVSPGGLTYTVLGGNPIPGMGGAFVSIGTVAVPLSATASGALLPPTAAAESVMNFVDTDPVENAENEYEVVPSVVLPNGAAMYGPPSNQVATTPTVLPDMPGLWQVASAVNYDTLSTSGYYVTATPRTLTTSTGTIIPAVEVEWSPAGAGSNAISAYQVWRGYSPQGLSQVATRGLSELTLTVQSSQSSSAVLVTRSLFHYLDKSPPLPIQDLYYGVAAVDVSGYVGAMVTTTVQGPLLWPAPLGLRSTYGYVNTSQGSKSGMLLTWSPSGGGGTFPFVGWNVQRIDQQGAPPKVLNSPCGFAPPYPCDGTSPSAALLQVQANSPASLSGLAEVIAADYPPPAGLPNNFTYPQYTIQAVDAQSYSGQPVTLFANGLPVPSSITSTPSRVQSLTCTVVAAPSGLPAPYSPEALGVSLSFAPNPVADQVLYYQVYRGMGIGAVPLASLSPTAAGALTPTSYVEDPAAGAIYAAGSSLTYTVVAINAKGAGVSATVQVDLLPPAPSWVSLTALAPSSAAYVTYSTVSLTWQDSLAGPDLTSTAAGPLGTGTYYVSRSDNVWPMPVAITSGASFIDTAPSAAAGVSYTVTAWFQGKTSLGSAVIPAPSLGIPPVLPSAVTASVGAGGVTLTWAGAPGAHTYWVYRSTNPLIPSGPGMTLPEAALFAQSPLTTFTDNGSSGQTAPYYAVAPVGPFVMGAAVAANGPIPPLAPTAVTATVAAVPGAGPLQVNPTVSLSWAASQSGSMVTEYLVSRSAPLAGAAGALTQVAAVAATSFTDSSLGTAPELTNTPLVYSVQAFGSGETSTAVSLDVTAYALPISPVAVAGTGTPGGVDVRWLPAFSSQGVTGYAVTWYSPNSGLGGTDVVPALPASWELGGLVPGQSVTVTVQALNSAGASPPSPNNGSPNYLAMPLALTANALGPSEEPYSLTLQSGQLPPAPGACAILLSISAPASGDVAIYRNPGLTMPASAMGHIMRLSNSSGGGNGANSAYYLTTVPGSIGTYQDLSVTVGDAYSYAITAVDSAGIPAGESLAVGGSPLTVTAYSTWYPPAVSGTAGNGRVDLWWSPPPPQGQGSNPLAGYRLYRSQVATATTLTAFAVDPGFPVLLSLTQTSFADTSVSNQLTYYYEMSSVDSAGDESAVRSFPVTTAGVFEPFVPSGPLPPPTNILAFPGNNSVALSWVVELADAYNGALYDVYRRNSPTVATDPTTFYQAPLPALYHVGPEVAHFPTGTLVPITMVVQSVVDDTAPNLQGVCYCVAAVNGAGEGPKSKELCVTPYNLLDPSQFCGTYLGVSVVATTQVQLSWNQIPVSGTNGLGGYSVEGYDVYRSVNDGASYTFLGETKPAGVLTCASTGDLLTYLDAGTAQGNSYYYKVQPKDTHGNEGLAYQLAKVDIPSGQNNLYVFRNSIFPLNAKLGATTVPIQCGLQQSGGYTVKIYTMSGEFVKKLIDDVSNGTPSSPYLSRKVEWDGTNSNGALVASGVYLIHLEGPGYRADARVAVIK